MGADDDPPKNPFIRWKQHVDTHIGVTLNGLLGIPAIVSKNLNIRNESDDGTTTAAAAADDSPAPPAQRPPHPGSAAGHSVFPPASSPGAHSPSDDGFLDGVDAVQLLEWHKFIYYSPYSPLKLQQQQHLHLLRPPVPNDVPFGADPYSFTYADAFEDLLRASSQRPLLDLTDRSYRNLRFQMRYGSAVEPPYAFFHRMHSQGLLDACFARSKMGGGAGEATAAADASSDGVVRAVAALAEQGRDLWREQQEEEDADRNFDPDDGEGGEKRRGARGGSDPWQDHVEEADGAPKTPGRQAGPAGGLFDELDRVFRVLGRIIDEDTTSTSAADGTSPKREKHHSRDTEPSAEDELYTAVRSAYASAEKSLATMIKSLASGFDSKDGFEPTSSAESAARRANGQSHEQGEAIQTTEEHVDAFGNRHVQTTVRWLDADGNEVSRETRYTVRSPTPQELAIKDTVDNDNEPAAAAEKTKAPKPGQVERGTKPSGWFWK